MKKILIVGSGLSGSVIARKLASQKIKVVIIDKRDHIGGNTHDYTNSKGIRIHRYGPHLFHTNNKKVVDLSSPMISNEGMEMVELYYTEELDPEGRGYQNLMRMMMSDGIFKYLPKQDDDWVDFLTPFMKLTRKEKKRYKNKNQL